MSLLKYLVEREKLDKIITFKGELSRSESYKELQTSDLLLHPHLVNGISNTMLEAIAAGKKVITFDSKINQYRLPVLNDIIIEVERYNYLSLAKSIAVLFKEKRLEVETYFNKIIKNLKRNTNKKSIIIIIGDNGSFQTWDSLENDKSFIKVCLLI